MCVKERGYFLDLQLCGANTQPSTCPIDSQSAGPCVLVLDSALDVSVEEPFEHCVLESFTGLLASCVYALVPSSSRATKTAV